MYKWQKLHESLCDESAQSRAKGFLWLFVLSGVFGLALLISLTDRMS